MNIGDIVLVKVTSQRARIVEERGNGYYAIEYMPDPASDPMDREQGLLMQEAGMYREGDLELVTD